MKAADGIPYKWVVSPATHNAFADLFGGNGPGAFKKNRTIKGTQFSVHGLRWFGNMRGYLALHEPNIYADRVETPDLFVVRISRLKCMVVYLNKDKGPQIIPSRGLPPVKTAIE
jgi:hypothetical protein